MAFVLYLAVNGEERGKGYGSQILDILKSAYVDKAIVLNIEPIDENAPNAEQRKSRLRFYNRNGSRLCTTTYAQDFGDYVAFMLLANEKEKAELYAKNENVKKKVGLVNDYFLKNFGIVLSK